MRVQEKKASAYMQPYENMVPNDPTFEEMKRVVCEEGRRPPIDSTWISDEKVGERLKNLGGIMKQKLKLDAMQVYLRCFE